MRPKRSLLSVLAVATLAVGLLAVAGSAGATSPGKNGKIAGGAGSMRAGVSEANGSLLKPRAIIQFGRMALREMAAPGPTNSDACLPLPNATDRDYKGNGTVDLFTAIARLDRRYRSPGTGWAGWGPLGGTLNTGLIYAGMPGDPNYARESCGLHSGGVLGDANQGTVLYPSWADLASPALHSVGLVTAGSKPGWTPDGSSPYSDGTWTDAGLAAVILGSSATLASEGHQLGRVEMAWPGGVPGCTSGAANCRVTDAVNGDNLIPDEVARRMAQGCVTGQTHTEYVHNVPYTSACGSTYGPVVATNRHYSTNVRSALNTDPMIGPGSSGRCEGKGTVEDCYYLRTWSLVGGKCTSTTDPCHLLSIPAIRPFGGRDCSTRAKCYQRPSDVLAAADLTALLHGFFVLQAYRFVEGSYRDQINPAERRSGNCLGPVDTHWTSVPETYCWNDLLAILDQLKADGYIPAGVDWPALTYRPGFLG
jgi:hypothetical protein